MTFDCRFQCSRVGLEVKIYDTPAGGIRASQGTFSSFPYFSKVWDRSIIVNVENIKNRGILKFGVF